MMDDCPAPSPCAPSHGWGQFPVPSYWWCWEDGDRDLLPDGSGCCPMCACGTLCAWSCFLGKKTHSRGYLYTTQQVAGGVFKFSCVTGLCCWQHRRARAGAAGWGILHGCYCHSPKWDRRHGLSASPGCLSWHSWSWGNVTGPAALPSAEPWALCHPVLCHLWILRADDLGGERRDGGRDGSGCLDSAP